MVIGANSAQVHLTEGLGLSLRSAMYPVKYCFVRIERNPAAPSFSSSLS